MLRLAVSLAAVSAAAASIAPGASLAAQPVRVPPADVRTPALALRSVQLVQRGTQLELRIRTRGAWSAYDVASHPKTSLCLVLSYGAPARPRSRVCVGVADGAAALTEVMLDANGAPVETPQPVGADVNHVGSVLEATFPPAEIALPYGHFRWAFQSEWTETSACGSSAPCSDRLPLTGAVGAVARLLVEPYCFGAAARDPRRPCSNPRLRRLVVPTPDEALITLNAPCARMPAAGLVHACAFGVSARRALDSAALIGDSHAATWRAAAEVAAQAFRWRGVSITRSGCPFTLGRMRTGPRSPAAIEDCLRWTRAVISWLGRHPEIHTVLMSGQSDNPFIGDPVSGYLAAIRAIPRSVRHVVVLRDDPRRPESWVPCLENLLRRHLEIGYRCAAPRSSVLGTDPAVTAARVSGERRAAVVDLSSFMCSTSQCFAVVGGALVQRDVYSHMTSVFATTLGPYLLQSLRRLGVSR